MKFILSINHEWMKEWANENNEQHRYQSQEDISQWCFNNDILTDFAHASLWRLRNNLSYQLSTKYDYTNTLHQSHHFLNYVHISWFGEYSHIVIENKNI